MFSDGVPPGEKSTSPKMDSVYSNRSVIYLPELECELSGISKKKNIQSKAPPAQQYCNGFKQRFQVGTDIRLTGNFVLCTDRMVQIFCNWIFMKYSLHVLFP